VRGQLSPSPVKHKENIVGFNQWIRLVKDKIKNIYIFSHTIFSPLSFLMQRFHHPSPFIFVNLLANLSPCHRSERGSINILPISSILSSRITCVKEILANNHSSFQSIASCPLIFIKPINNFVNSYSLFQHN